MYVHGFPRENPCMNTFFVIEGGLLVQCTFNTMLVGWPRKGGGAISPGDNFDGENFIRGNFVTPSILMQGHQTPEGKFSLGQNFVTPPTLGSLWTIWPRALLFIFSGVQLGIFCGGPPFFSFHHWCTCHNVQLPNMQWLGQKISSIVP